MYGQDTTAQSLQKHVRQTTFVKILKVEMVTARWYFYKDVNLLPHMGGTTIKNAA